MRTSALAHPNMLSSEKSEVKEMRSLSNVMKSAAPAIAVLSLVLGGGVARATMVFGPTPYQSFNDSPFQPLLPQFNYFHLETYEELNAPTNSPGVTTTGTDLLVVGPGSLVDSVDGGGSNGHSLFSSTGSTGILFTFDAAVLGHLPTHAAIAWTDGDGPNRTFEAFDSHGALIGTIVDPSPSFFDTGDGDPRNYRLFGAIDSQGISAIFMGNDGGGIEVDHLQYGYMPSTTATTPEPSSLTLLSLALFGLSGYVWRRRRADYQAVSA
jgi:hypothetical protein